jgi:hypothetical protein
MKRFLHVQLITVLIKLADLLDDLIFVLTIKLDDIFTGEKF